MSDRDNFGASPGNETPPSGGGSARLGPGGWFAIAVLFAFLGVAGWYAIHAWGELPGVPISPLGWLFLVLGVLTTIGVGAGLMALVFYSSRKGRDF